MRAQTSNLFFFNDTATTEIYTLSLHDALPISLIGVGITSVGGGFSARHDGTFGSEQNLFLAALVMSIIVVSLDRKSTRLNSSHQIISYAVFCLKKKTPMHHTHTCPAINLWATT